MRRTTFIQMSLAVVVGSAALIVTARADPPRTVVAPPAAPLVRDRDPLLPDRFNPPRSLVFVTRDDPAFVRFLGRVRPAVEVEPRGVEVQPEGIDVIDGSDADRDGYVEYFDGGAYVAELKKQAPLKDASLLRIAGVLHETYAATYEEHDEPHLLLRLAHANGKHALVDAGPAVALKKLGLQAGDAVTVAARMGLVNQRPALIAEELQHDSTTVKIVRGRPIR